VGVCSYPCSAKCAKDTDCKDARICDHGTCVWPTADGGGNNGPQCLIDGVFVSAGATNPADSCEYCDPAQNQLDWTSTVALGATYTPPPNASVTGIWSFASRVQGVQDSVLVGESISNGPDTSYQITVLDSAMVVQSRLPLGATPSSLAIADLNGDGFNDLVVGGFGYSSTNENLGSLMSLVLNDAQGGFLPGVTHPFPQTNAPPSFVQLEDLKIGDFNGDGTQELSVATFEMLGSWQQGVTRVDTYALDGQGGLVALWDLSLQLPLVGTLMAGDANRDGKTDLRLWVPDNGSGASLTLLLSQGGGQFTVSSEVYPSYSPYSSGGSVIPCDFDGDGRSDVAFANGDGTTSVELSGTNGTLSPAKNSGPPFDANTAIGQPSLIAGDFDGDGYLDLARQGRVCRTDGCTFEFSLLIGLGDGTFRRPDNVGSILPPDWNPNPYGSDRTMATLSLGAGRSDLVFSYYYPVGGYMNYSSAVSILHTGCR
jgi:hypothetical protein